MKILLIGYGKMGKAIELIAKNRGHEITGHFDVTDNPPFPPSDVAIEFTQREAAVGNIKQCVAQGIPVVCGTTGWMDHFEEVAEFCKKNNAAFFYSSNYSLGVNIFFKLNEFLAKMMNAYPQYDVTIDETHHTEKKDSPSGTAITLANGIIRNLTRKKEWAKNPNPETLVINSFRKDPAPGTHVIRYHSEIDDLEIVHTAHSREGFAVGAVLVAEWIVGKKGVFSMDDFLKF
jgi:4-hydroxy-tetrahydrodipicolinate reductase